MLVGTVFCVFMLIFRVLADEEIGPTTAVPIENVEERSGMPALTNTNNSVITIRETEVLCQNADFLARILNVVLPLLARNVSGSTKTILMVQILKELLNSSPQSIQNDEVMFKMNDLLQTLEKYNVGSKSNSLRSIDNVAEQIDGVKSKVSFKFEIPTFANPDCTAELISIINTVQESISRLVTNPVCRIHLKTAVLPQYDVNSILLNPMQHVILNKIVSSTQIPDTQDYVNKVYPVPQYIEPVSPPVILPSEYVQDHIIPENKKDVNVFIQNPTEEIPINWFPTDIPYNDRTDSLVVVDSDIQHIIDNGPVRPSSNEVAHHDILHSVDILPPNNKFEIQDIPVTTENTVEIIEEIKPIQDIVEEIVPQYVDSDVIQTTQKNPDSPYHYDVSPTSTPEINGIPIHPHEDTPSKDVPISMDIVRPEEYIPESFPYYSVPDVHPVQKNYEISEIYQLPYWKQIYYNIFKKYPIDETWSPFEEVTEKRIDENTSTVVPVDDNVRQEIYIPDNSPYYAPEPIDSLNIYPDQTVYEVPEVKEIPSWKPSYYDIYKNNTNEKIWSPTENVLDIVNVDEKTPVYNPDVTKQEIYIPDNSADYAVPISIDNSKIYKIPETYEIPYWKQIYYDIFHKYPQEEILGPIEKVTEHVIDDVHENSPKDVPIDKLDIVKQETYIPDHSPYYGPVPIENLAIYPTQTDYEISKTYEIPFWKKIYYNIFKKYPKDEMWNPIEEVTEKIIDDDINKNTPIYIPNISEIYNADKLAPTPIPMENIEMYPAQKDNEIPYWEQLYYDKFKKYPKEETWSPIEVVTGHDVKDNSVIENQYIPYQFDEPEKVTESEFDVSKDRIQETTLSYTTTYPVDETTSKYDRKPYVQPANTGKYVPEVPYIYPSTQDQLDIIVPIENYPTHPELPNEADLKPIYHLPEVPYPHIQDFDLVHPKEDETPINVEINTQQPILPDITNMPQPYPWTPNQPESYTTVTTEQTDRIVPTEEYLPHYDKEPNSQPLKPGIPDISPDVPQVYPLIPDQSEINAILPEKYEYSPKPEYFEFISSTPRQFTVPDRENQEVKDSPLWRLIYDAISEIITPKYTDKPVTPSPEFEVISTPNNEQKINVITQEIRPSISSNVAAPTIDQNVILLIKENLDLIEHKVPELLLNMEVYQYLEKIKHILSLETISIQDYITIVNQYERLMEYIKKLNINNEILEKLLATVTSITGKSNIIELTYLVRRPKPVVYQPYYYVKYRLPYTSFLTRVQQLLIDKPYLKTDPVTLYKELLTLSNVAETSPDLEQYQKEDIFKLTARNGTLLDAKVVEGQDADMYASLDVLKNVNSDISLDEAIQLIKNTRKNKLRVEEELALNELAKGRDDLNIKLRVDNEGIEKTGMTSHQVINEVLKRVQHLRKNTNASSISADKNSKTETFEFSVTPSVVDDVSTLTPIVQIKRGSEEESDLSKLISKNSELADELKGENEVDNPGLDYDYFPLNIKNGSETTISKNSQVNIDEINTKANVSDYLPKKSVESTYMPIVSGKPDIQAKLLAATIAAQNNQKYQTVHSHNLNYGNSAGHISDLQSHYLKPSSANSAAKISGLQTIYQNPSYANSAGQFYSQSLYQNPISVNSAAQSPGLHTIYQNLGSTNSTGISDLKSLYLKPGSAGQFSSQTLHQNPFTSNSAGQVSGLQTIYHNSGSANSAGISDLKSLYLKPGSVNTAGQISSQTVYQNPISVNSGHISGLHTYQNPFAVNSAGQISSQTVYQSPISISSGLSKANVVRHHFSQISPLVYQTYRSPVVKYLHNIPSNARYYLKPGQLNNLS